MRTLLALSLGLLLVARGDGVGQDARPNTARDAAVPFETWAAEVQVTDALIASFLTAFEDIADLEGFQGDASEVDRDQVAAIIESHGWDAERFGWVAGWFQRAVAANAVQKMYAALGSLELPDEAARDRLRSMLAAATGDEREVIALELEELEAEVQAEKQRRATLPETAVRITEEERALVEKFQARLVAIAKRRGR